jgi:hypothetical protein
VTSSGSGSNPVLTNSGCIPGAYKVLRVQKGTVDTTVCNGVDGVTNNYTFEWPVDPSINDYVLCLQKL